MGQCQDKEVHNTCSSMKRFFTTTDSTRRVKCSVNSRVSGKHVTVCLSRHYVSGATYFRVQNAPHLLKNSFHLHHPLQHHLPDLAIIQTPSTNSTSRQLHLLLLTKPNQTCRTKGRSLTAHFLL